MKTGTIYLIGNTVNDKVYIGQTINDLGTRLKAHKQRAKVFPKRKLYKAMNDLGHDKFFIKAIRKRVPLENLDQAEIETIALYNSIANGYNSFDGGYGRSVNKEYDDEQIAIAYLKGLSSGDIAKRWNVSYATVLRSLIKTGIKPRHDGNKYEAFADSFEETWKKGVYIKDMAKMYGVNEKTIRRHAARLGLRRNKRGLGTTHTHGTIPPERAKAVRGDMEAHLRGIPKIGL